MHVCAGHCAGQGSRPLTQDQDLADKSTKHGCINRDIILSKAIFILIITIVHCVYPPIPPPSISMQPRHYAMFWGIRTIFFLSAGESQLHFRLSSALRHGAPRRSQQRSVRGGRESGMLLWLAQHQRFSGRVDAAPSKITESRCTSQHKKMTEKRRLVYTRRGIGSCPPWSCPWSHPFCSMEQV